MGKDKMVGSTAVKACFAALLLSVSPSVTLAQPSVSDAAPADPEAFREGFEPTRLSAAIVTGLWIGGRDRESVLEADLLVPNTLSGEAGEADQICVRAMTRDGLFWSSNAYTASSSADLWRIGSITMKFENELQAYSLGDLFVTAGRPRAGGGCDGVLPALTPVLRGGGDDLNIVVNSQGRIAEADFVMQQDTRIAGVCTPTERPRHVADTRCVFNLGADSLSGDATLEITLSDPPFDSDLYTVEVLLPEQGLELPDGAQ